MKFFTKKTISLALVFLSSYLFSAASSSAHTPYDKHDSISLSPRDRDGSADTAELSEALELLSLSGTSTTLSISTCLSPQARDFFEEPARLVSPPSSPVVHPLLRSSTPAALVMPLLPPIREEDIGQHHEEELVDDLPDNIDDYFDEHGNFKGEACGDVLSASARPGAAAFMLPPAIRTPGAQGALTSYVLSQSSSSSACLSAREICLDDFDPRPVIETADVAFGLKLTDLHRPVCILLSCTDPDDATSRLFLLGKKHDACSFFETYTINPEMRSRRFEDLLRMSIAALETDDVKYTKYLKKELELEIIKLVCKAFRNIFFRKNPDNAMCFEQTAHEKEHLEDFWAKVHEQRFGIKCYPSIKNGKSVTMLELPFDSIIQNAYLIIDCCSPALRAAARARESLSSLRRSMMRILYEEEDLFDDCILAREASLLDARVAPGHGIQNDIDPSLIDAFRSSF